MINKILRDTISKRKKDKYVKNIGMGIVAPKEAIKGGYSDNKCPFKGKISIRGRVLRGTVISTKMNRTLIIRRDYLHWIKKYKRFEKRHKNIACHCSPCFRVKEGDIVTIGQCRPLSKTVRFNVIRIDRQTSKLAKKVEIS
jgi:small subunit ribosomal protein S11e|mmetsp:Transcript_99957/g.145991  ORF Transcript_99957/g.145991 Transcript_99957/m.145991 type:complete len:141 (+) Transcript_99957:68-490(+)